MKEKLYFITRDGKKQCVNEVPSEEYLENVKKKARESDAVLPNSIIGKKF